MSGVEKHAPRPFALAPIVAATRAPSNKRAARKLGIDPSQFYRWKRLGLTVDQADTLACRLGMHPYEVWPEWLGVLEVAG